MDFENFYITWYSRVAYFAREYVTSEADAENIVQDVFIDLYKRRDMLGQHVNIIAYLFTCVKNRCLDHLRRQMVERKAAIKIQYEFELSFRMKLDSLEAFDTNSLTEDGMADVLNQALQTLPKRCRQIFIMSRLEGKKQKQIAEELNISINTVEAQMSVAYKKLRDELKPYIPLLFSCFKIINKCWIFSSGFFSPVRLQYKLRKLKTSEMNANTKMTQNPGYN